MKPYLLLSFRAVSFLLMLLLILTAAFQTNGQGIEFASFLNNEADRTFNYFPAVNDTNSPPVANSDSYTVHGIFYSSQTGVLENDTDPDPGDALTAVGGSFQTPLGTASIYAYGLIVFQANYGATGTTSMPYTVCDNHNACSSSTVTFNVVNQNPVGVSDSYNIHGSLDTGGGNIPGVLANDTDPEGDSLSVPGSYGYPVQTGLGNGVITPVGRVMFTAAYGVTGSVTVSYPVCDNYGACSTGSVTFNVINESPTVEDDSYTVEDGSFETPLVSPAPYGVLKNDSDPENDPITALDVSYDIPNSTNPVGRAGVFSNGKAFYIRIDGTFSGTVTIPYTVRDYLGATSQGQVTFYVLDFGDESNAGASCPLGNVGEPVNVTNGNMWSRQSDYKLPGIGESIDLTRTYNSIKQSSGLFGYGWTTRYDQFISVVDNRLVKVYLEDGRAVYFGRTNAGSAFTPIDGKDFQASLTKNTDNTYTLTYKDGRIHQFSAGGRLLWQKDRNGNQTTLTYDVNGNLSGITDGFGRTLTVTTNSGYVTQISDSLGTIATYEYYPYPNTNLLKTVTYSDGSKYKFEYVNRTINNQTKTFLATIKDALDNILETHDYDFLGRATTSEKAGGAEKYTLDYTHAGDGIPYTTVTDALGRVTKYTYDKSKGKNVITKVEGNCGCGSGAEVTTYDYDDRVNLVKKVDALGREIIYTYDGSGNRLTGQDKIGTVDLGTETYTYNAFGQVLTRTDKMGGVTTNTYNTAGNLETTTDALGSVTTIVYPATGNKGLPDSMKDARLNVIKFKWFTTGLLQEVEDPYGKKTNYSYDARGRTKTITDALLHTTTYNYFDDTQRKIEMIYPNADKITYRYDVRRLLESVTDERGKQTNYEFDTARRLKKITDPLLHTKEFDYDLMSNMDWTKDALGFQTDYAYDDFNRLKEVTYPPAETGATRLKEKYEYDAVGRIKKQYDTANRLTEYAYDDANRTNTVTNPELETTQTKYNAREQMIEVKDALNQIYTFTNDPLGRVLTQTRAGTTMTYEYDAVGNRKKRIDYAGRETSYEYDLLNRLKKINYLQTYGGVPVQTPIQTATYTYDDISQLKTATNEAGTVTFNYDNRNRIESTTDVFGHTVAYEYELTSTVNQKRLKFDGAMYAKYNFDDANRLANIFNQSDSTTITFGYDNEDKLTSRIYPNGITTTYDYDGMDRLKRLKDVSTTATLFDRQMTYNTASQINQITEPANMRSFGYDLADRLKTVTASNNQNENYNFDDVGNRTSSHRSASYAYQSNNKLTSTDTAVYNYDANGNMVSKGEGSNFWRYAFDYENRLTTASTRKQTVRYLYDALGRRVQRHLKGSKKMTKFIYDGQDVLVDDNSGTLTKYLNGAGIDNKLRVQTGSDVKYFLTDHLGSTNALTDSSGAISEQTAYDSFGNATTNLSTRYQFTGREFDSFTNLHYYRARFYDANLGRFISEDPIGLTGGINQFGYVGNNAQNLIDPNGTDGVPKCPKGRCGPSIEISIDGGEPPRRPPHFISDPPPSPSPTPSSTPFPPMGGDPPSASSSPCDCGLRFPDFYTFNIGGSLRQLPVVGNMLPEQLGGGFSVTVDRYYGLYGGYHYGFNVPGSYKGMNLTAGYMLERCQPNKEKLAGFLSGDSKSVGGFGPVPGLAGIGNLGGFYTWNNNGSAISLGVSNGSGLGGSTGSNTDPFYLF